MDDIAVIGMGMRFPGRASSAEGLWSVMTEAESQWSAFPSDRLNIQGFYHPSRNRQGSIPFRGAHLLQSDVTKFDAPFFSMTADEAGAVDPQQRMLLEVTYEALENAGLRKEDLDGSPTAVFVGSFVKDYEQVCLRDPDDSPQYAATGNGIALMSNRISYFFNFHGPSETVDTGCSGSLVSIHNAVQSLRSHESSLGIAAGAGLILTPATMMPMTALNFLSPDGKCFTFDDRANGYGRGEGIGVIILKRLSDALRDNDIVRAVIRGSSKNQDGRTLGITLPSAEAQAENIRSAYSVAGLGFTQTGFVECHGTGTQAGDWRELKAISETISKDRCDDSPVVAGSVKPNIGHLEGAAGIAGMIKGVLVLEHGKIPPQANYQTSNPQLELADWRIKIPTTVLEWPLAGLRRVSVNCFGFGGSNVHVVMDDAANYLTSRKLEGQHNTTLDLKGLMAPPESKAPTRYPRTFYPFLFSAPDKLALERTLKAHLQYLVGFLPAQDGPTFLRDYAYTLACRRSVFPWKAQVVCSSRSDLVKDIKSLDASSFYRSSKARQRICFAFGGQGAQSPGMGKDLVVFEVFRESLTAASTYMREHLRSPFMLLDEILLEGRGSRISNPEIAQPATTAIQIALVELMQSFGISPSHVIGHSSGEIAAAFACGTLTRESAWEVAYWRGFYAATIPLLAPDEPGAMMAVGLGADDMQFFLDQRPESAQIACINSPTSTTLAGRRSRIENIAAELEQEGIFHRILPVDVAYHSNATKLVSRQYEWSLEGIINSSSSQRARMFSTVTGREVPNTDLTTKYWSQNMTSQVQYLAALAAMLDSPVYERPDLIIEISPRSQLQSPTLDSMSWIKLTSPVPYLSVAGTQAFDQESLQACLGSLWQQGGSVNLVGVLNESNTMPKCLVDLPTYPWNHTKSYWHESHLSTSIRFRKHGREDLIGVLTPDSTPYEPKWRGFLRVFENPWLQDHKIQKTIVYPAAGMITMAFEAAKQLSEGNTRVSGYEITDMTIEKAIIVPETKHGVEVALNLTRPDIELKSSGNSRERFAIYSKQLDSPWQRNASGHVRICVTPNDAEQTFHTHHAKYESARSSCTNAIVPRHLYEVLDNIGMNYGPTFRNIKELRTNAQTCVSRVAIPDTRAKMPEKFEFTHLLHAATLDSMFHTLFAIDSTPMVPVFLRRIFVSVDVAQSEGREFVGVSEAKRQGFSRASADISMFLDQRRQAQVIMEGLEFSRIAVGDSSDAAYVSNNSHLATEIIWEKDIAFAIPKGLAELLRLLSHKVPGLSILDVGQDDRIRATVLAAIAPGPGITPRLRRYSLVEPKIRGDSERCKDQLKASGLEDFVEIVDRPTVTSGVYDLILATNYNDMSATQLQQLLSGQGLLICSRPSVSSKLSCIAEDETILDIHRHSTVPDLESEEQVTVLIPETANTELAELVNNLRAAIRKKGFQVGIIVTSLSAFISDGFSNSSPIMVSLLDFPDGSDFSVYDWDQHTFDCFHALQRQAKRMLWITRGAHRNPSNPRASPIMGLIRTLISEDPLKRYATLDLGSQTELADPRTSDAIFSVLQAVFLARSSATATLDAEYAEEEGGIYIPRLAPTRSLNNLIEPSLASQEISGVPFSTYNEDGAAPVVLSHSLVSLGSSMIGHYTKIALPKLGPGEIEVDFQSAFLTEQDADIMSGRVIRDAVGLDVSGRVRHIGTDLPSSFETGAEITGIAFNGTLRSTLHLDHRLARIVPKSFVPSIYIAAYYALVHIGRAQKKNIVLIRGAASAHGLAAVVVARRLGLDVYASISGGMSDDQQRTLEGLGVPSDRIWDEHSVVSQDILRQVSRGIDIVYNTLSNTAYANLLPIRDNGYFVQFGQIHANDMAQMRSNGVTLSSFEPYSLIKNNVELASIMLEAALRLLADAESLPVLHNIVQPIEKADKALQELAQAPHSACALVYADSSVSNVVNVIKDPQIKPLSEVIGAEGTYVIVGGFLGLGGSIAKLLVKNGARHLVFVSRSGASKDFLKQLQSSDVIVRAVSADVCDATALRAEIKIITDTMPPIQGVFQCAAVISDAVFDNMTFDDWSAAIRCKTVGSWNLVEVLKNTGMDPFYIFLASSAGVIGNRGQANYAAGNSFEDSMARTLRLQGKHAVSIDLGPVLGTGMLADDEQTLDMLRASGFHSISHDDFLNVLSRAITGEIVEGQPMPPQVVLGVGTGAVIRQNRPADPYWTRTALYSYLNLIDMPTHELSGRDRTSSMGLRAMLTQASTVAVAGELISEGIRDVLAKAMTLLPEEIDAGKPPNAYGVDSLVAIGLRNWVQGQCGVEISLFEVLSELSVAEMGLMIARKGGYGGGSDARGPEGDQIVWDCYDNEL